jgi:hypothetical protein
LSPQKVQWCLAPHHDVEFRPVDPAVAILDEGRQHVLTQVQQEIGVTQCRLRVIVQLGLEMIEIWLADRSLHTECRS